MEIPAEPMLSEKDLLEAGLSKEEAGKVIQAIAEERVASAERVLSKNRTKLLDKLHETQNRLYILDTLIQRIHKGGPR